LNKSKDKDLVPLKEAISNNQFFWVVIAF
jgi:hypothetical protein